MATVKLGFFQLHKPKKDSIYEIAIRLQGLNVPLSMLGAPFYDGFILLDYNRFKRHMEANPKKGFFDIKNYSSEDYILLKKFNYSRKKGNVFNLDVKKETEKIQWFLHTLRLQPNIYFSMIAGEVINTLYSFNIGDNNKFYYETAYKSFCKIIDNNDLKLAKNNLRIIERYKKDLNLYFNLIQQAFVIKELRIAFLNLCICLEALLLKDSEKIELRKTITIRANYLIKEDISAFMKLIYDARSQLAHNGKFSKDIQKDIDKVFGKKDTTLNEVQMRLFEYIKIMLLYFMKNIKSKGTVSKICEDMEHKIMKRIISK